MDRKRKNQFFEKLGEIKYFRIGKKRYQWLRLAQPV